MDRHHRQTLLPQIGDAGQARLRAARVAIVGVGALGGALADHLARAGVGRLTLIDRDVVELTNLQRQTLYAMPDLGLPKVEAARRRLMAIDPSLDVRPLALDLDGRSTHALDDAELILDGSDNAELRYLLNDACVQSDRAFVMAGVIGVEGRVAVLGGGGPCLRCLFPTPPAAGELATCDTAGVLGPAVGVVASVQAAMAIRQLVEPDAPRSLVTIDAWRPRVATIDLRGARRGDCPCCGERRFEFLDRPPTAARLCGRDSVQLRSTSVINLDALADRLASSGEVALTPLMLRFVPRDGTSLAINLFGDGRAIVQGTSDPAVARSLVARFVGV